MKGFVLFSVSSIYVGHLRCPDHRIDRNSLSSFFQHLHEKRHTNDFHQAIQ
nr:MAG TPA: hypothetical protein [Herelleviridae sp.]